jgi:hypothetical protein
MTEAEWLAGDHPYRLIYHKSCRSIRKRRLLVCACVRRVLTLLPEEIYTQGVEFAEKLADGLATDQERKTMYRNVGKALRSASDFSESQNCAAQSVRALLEREFMSFKMAIESAGHARAAEARPNWNRGHDEETAQQVILARDIFANPFRPTAIDSGWLQWRNGTILQIAQTIYDEKRFSDLPILADALEDAGCEDQGLLEHCRHSFEHVRGCWVLDLLLGKT